MVEQLLQIGTVRGTGRNTLRIEVRVPVLELFCVRERTLSAQQEGASRYLIQESSPRLLFRAEIRSPAIASGSVFPR